MLDWLRLKDQFDALETGSKRPESRGPALCQEPWTDCGYAGAGVDKPVSDRGSFPVPPPCVDVTWR